MPSIYDLKPHFQRVLRPLSQTLAGFGITPNAITLLAMLGSCGVGTLVLRATQQPAWFLLVPAWLLLRMALNVIDGMIAREFQMTTPLGAVLNELGDVISDLMLYLPFAFLSPPAQWPVVAFTMGAILTEFCGVLAGMLAGSRRYEGPMGKSDRAFLVGLLALLTFAVPPAMALWPWVFGIAALLTAVTCWQRLAKALKA
jgi:CDP-diacylglycerol--glycerol-3-phosphate 3-phosphatidyltransferase